jgi:hypothetical protein
MSLFACGVCILTAARVVALDGLRFPAKISRAAGRKALVF